MNRPVCVATFVAFACLTARVAAQSATLATLHGLAFDSLHNVQLSGAYIVIVGTNRTTTSDDRGHFEFDSVAPGAYQLAMRHDALDAIGLSGVTARTVIADGRDTVVVAIPSFNTLWRATCRGTAPRDSGLIYGTVRSVGGAKGSSGATVTGSWIDVDIDKTVISQKRWRLDVNTDDDGSYSLCGVPLSTGVRLRAADAMLATGEIDLNPLDKDRVLRRDLLMARTPNLDSTSRGSVVGVVTSGAGIMAEARVIADGVDEARTGPDGRFVLHGMPAGTRQIEARAIGFAPATVIVDVVPHDTAYVNIDLHAATVLDTVRVSADSTVRQRLIGQFSARRKLGLGYFKDSTQLASSNTLQDVFAGMPVTVRMVRGGVPIFDMLRCKTNVYVWIDGMTDVLDRWAGLRPQDVAVIEVYPSDTAPPEFRPHAAMKGCAVVIWTKRGWR